MFKLQTSSPIWLLCTFLSIGFCFTSVQQAQAATVTDPIEVTALKSLAQKWSIDLKTSISKTWKTPWNLTGDPCTGRAIDNTPITDSSMNPAFKCDCTFNNGNTCHITQLKVYAMDITGQIPEELANLTYLWDLNLAQNYLTGPIPAFLGNLTRMLYLSLGTNNLSGPVPKELGNLRNLIELSFSSNNLNETLPSDLGNLTALQDLSQESGKVQVGKGMATIPAGINVRDMASPPPRSLMQTQVQEVAENVNGCAIQDSALSTVKSANTMAFMPMCGGEEGGLNRRTLCIIAGLVHHAISHLGSWSACNWDVNQIWHDSGWKKQRNQLTGAVLVTGSSLENWVRNLPRQI